jgi:hypothetical protein
VGRVNLDSFTGGQCPLVALFGPAERRRRCPVLGVERKWLANGTRRANQSVHRICRLAPFEKIFWFSEDPNHLISAAVPLLRGALRNVTDAERDAVDAGGALDGRCGWRTEKSCGPDAPVLASSSRKATFADDGGKKAGRRGEHEGSR